MADKPLLEADVAEPAMVELTIVVFAPAVGAVPLPFPKEGVFGEVARSKT